MLTDDDRLHEDDEDVKLTREGWQEEQEFEEDYAAYLDQQRREIQDLRDWARYTLETGDSRCECHAGWRCFRCRVHAIVYPGPCVREFEMGEVPF